MNLQSLLPWRIILMREYSYSEKGMLIGTVLGGCSSVIGFFKTESVWFYVTLALAFTVGLLIGKVMDRKIKEKNQQDGIAANNSNKSFTDAGDVFNRTNGLH
jgi:hypothetical protein